MFRAFVWAIILSCTSGCGLLLQTAVGWNSRETVQKTEMHAVKISSRPDGAEVVRRSPDGQESTLGTAPLTDQVPYQVEVTTESPRFVALLIGGALQGAATYALFKASAGTGSDAARLGLAITGGLFAYLTLEDLVVALIHGLSGGSVVGRKIVDGNKSYLYAGRRAGLPDGLAMVRVPDQTMAELILEIKTTTPIEVATKKTETQWVVAVMPVEDLNAGTTDKAIDLDLVRNLGDQLRVFVSQRGVRTVDPSAQDRALKDQIASAKQESYKECYDDSCQIELGKALAASHILRTRITRFGRRCVLNAELVELRAEVTVSAASSQGDCEAEGFLTMSESVATNLFKP